MGTDNYSDEEEYEEGYDSRYWVELWVEPYAGDDLSPKMWFICAVAAPSK